MAILDLIELCEEEIKQWERSINIHSVDCLSNVGYEEELTTGKMYHHCCIVSTYRGLHYRVLNDLGYTKYYPVYLFSEIKYL